jgi:tRNA pseudouridine38-40 synthase
MPPLRYKLLLSYRGTRYHGWQQQAMLPTYKGEPPPPGCGIPTIQETRAKVMGEVCGHPVTIIGSSRTDAGVHAKGQIAHMDTTATHIPPENLRRAVNHRLPDDIIIREITIVPRDFDSISGAIAKRYQYFVWNASDRNPFCHDLCWHRWQPLNTGAMKEAAAHFIGEKDFTSFCKPGHGRETTVRTVHDCQVSAHGPKIVIGIAGNGFLWNMIRIIVGTIVEVGLDLYLPSDIPKMLAALDRRKAGSTAPPHGLWLQWIKMRDEEIETPFK